jgi:hypothetical protein
MPTSSPAAMWPLLDAVAQVVERRQVARRVRCGDDVVGQLQLREQIGLDGDGPLGGRAADVRERVQRIDVLEDDRLQLGRRRIAGPLQAVQHRLAEAPLHRGMDGGEPLLDLRLHAGVQLFHAALHGHGEERQHLAERRELGRREVAGPR